MFFSLNAHVFERDAGYDPSIADRFPLGDFDIPLQLLRGQLQAEVVANVRVRRGVRLLILRDRREPLEGDVLRLRPHVGEDLAGVRRAVARLAAGELHLDVVEAASSGLRQYRQGEDRA